MNIGIVVCSRTDSQRIPNKPFVKINGKYILENLLERLKDFDTRLAVPSEQSFKYQDNLKWPATKLFTGHGKDPLARTFACATVNKLDAVVRITHDKILVEPELIKQAIEIFKSSDIDYLFSNHFTDGSGFEIISTKALGDAYKKYVDVEHISYAIRSVTNKIHNFKVPPEYQSRYRFLIDFKDDIKLLEVIFSKLGNDCTLKDAIKFIDENPWARDINKTPLVTVYTCVYNGEEFLENAMESVAEQKGFENFEYLLIDDSSTDYSFYEATKFASKHKRVECYRNETNLGLSSSSNKALKLARGKYIIRLDADDYFINNNAINSLVEKIELDQSDVVYPNNYFGCFSSIQKGNESHHVGGSIFSTRALNHVKFTDKLMGYEGLDLYARAKDQLKISYLDEPVFFYRQHDKSLSKNDLEKRASIKTKIESGIVGDALINETL